MLYERVLPLSGALGFWLCCYAGFLLIYAGVCGTQWPGRVVIDKLVRVMVASAGLLVLAIVLDQIGYVLLRGWDAIRHSNFFSQTMALAGPLDPLTSGGMVHALVGSLEQMAISTVIAVPLGVFAALFLVEVGGPLARPVRTIVEAMTALPEIIAGLFIYAFAILSLGIDQSGFAAALALTVMMIPIVTRSSEVILRLVPGGLREASYALGASQARTGVHDRVAHRALGSRDRGHPGDGPRGRRDLAGAADRRLHQWHEHEPVLGTAGEPAALHLQLRAFPQPTWCRARSAPGSP